jgi:Flp pilus assembly protein TadD
MEDGKLKPQVQLRAVRQTDRGTALAKARTLLQAGDPAKAEALLRDVGNVSPPAQFNTLLGVAVLRQGRREEAMSLLRQAIDDAGDDSAACNAIGVTLHMSGAVAMARAAYRRALDIDPDFAEAWNHLGLAEWHGGDVKSAELALRRAIALRPLYGEAHANLVSVRDGAVSDDDRQALEALLEGDAGGLVPLHFAMWRVYDRLGEFDRAFAHLATGNSRKRSGFRFDAARDEDYMARIAGAFDADLMSRLDGAGPTTPGPVFIAAMPRSGTSLIERIIASHPLAAGAGETTAFPDAVRLAGGKGRRLSMSRMAEADPATLRAVGDRYVAVQERLFPGASRIVDKLTSNFLYVGLIHLCLPGATIIDNRRDPMALGFSCFAQLFTGGMRFAYDLAEIGRYTRAYRRLTSHWRDLLPNRMYTLTYEDLATKPEPQIRSLIEHLGLAWDGACLAPEKSGGATATASASRVLRPIDADAVAHWRNYERHLGPLRTALEG